MKTNKDLIIEPNAAIEGRKYSEENQYIFVSDFSFNFIKIKV